MPGAYTCNLRVGVFHGAQTANVMLTGPGTGDRETDMIMILFWCGKGLSN